jgi:hypothetical protein
MADRRGLQHHALNEKSVKQLSHCGRQPSGAALKNMPSRIGESLPANPPKPSGDAPRTVPHLEGAF